MNAQIADRPEADIEPDDHPYDTAAPAPRRRGRGGFDPQADAAASAARYEVRQRSVLGLLIAAIMTAALALIVSPVMWWVCGLATVGLAGYLFYLRRQVRLEQEIRRRRLARLQRSRREERDEFHDGHSDDGYRRHRGAVVLELDEEDPEFEHLDRYDDYYYADGYDGYDDVDDRIPRAAGE